MGVASAVWLGAGLSTASSTAARARNPAVFRKVLRRKNRRPVANPFDSARAKGAQAFLAGRHEADCPYRDHRKADGRLTFSRAWRLAWLDGFREQKKKALLDDMVK